MSGLILLLLLLIGFCAGYCYRRKQALSDAHAVRCYVDALTRQIETLKGEIARLQNADARRQADAASRKLRFEQNDVSNPENQIRFISQTGLRATSPVNKEAVRVLYALEEWIKANRSGWRLSFEVGLGAFIKTNDGQDELSVQQAFSSYNSKRVDFLLIDNYGAPMLAVEYHGSGHYLSDDAEARMQVKRLALSRAGIPLVEIPAKTSRPEILQMISACFAVSAPTAPVP